VTFSTPPVTFQAGAHALSITHVADGQWTVSVDGAPDSRTFGTQVEAWEAGVRAAADLDRVRSP
jgi:Uncharacterized protein conserved in bacteria (DUF2188)